MAASVLIIEAVVQRYFLKISQNLQDTYYYITPLVAASENHKQFIAKILGQIREKEYNLWWNFF